MKKMFVCFASALFISSWCCLGAMKPVADNSWHVARFNNIVSRAQLHFHDLTWLPSRPVLKDHHDTICEFLKQQDFSLNEFMDFLEEAFDYYLLLHKQWERSHDLIACRVRDGVFDFFNGFGDILFIFLENTEFSQQPQALSLEAAKRLSMLPHNKHGLEAAFWYIFAFQLKEQWTDEEEAKIYTFAYVQDDVLSILDGLERIDRLGYREEANFGKIAAQIIVLMQKLDVIANICHIKKLSWKTATFFDLFVQKVVMLCSISACLKF
jgi:hypothetical protein